MFSVTSEMKKSEKGHTLKSEMCGICSLWGKETVFNFKFVPVLQMVKKWDEKRTLQILTYERKCLKAQ